MLLCALAICGKAGGKDVGRGLGVCARGVVNLLCGELLVTDSRQRCGRGGRTRKDALSQEVDEGGAVEDGGLGDLGGVHCEGVFVGSEEVVGRVE